jgi:hypothetical protein
MTLVKTIYLVRRNPTLSYEEFVARWRKHAALSGSFPAVLRRFEAVVQCRRVTAALDESLGLRQEFDGANLLGLTSLFDSVDVHNQDGIPVLRADELEVFGSYVKDSSMTGIEHALLDGDHSRIVLLEFYRRGVGEDLNEFMVAWTGRHARAVMAEPAFTSVRRYVHNHVVLPSPDGWDYDGVGEIWFDDVDSAVEYLQERPLTDGVLRPEWSTLLELNHVWFKNSH